MFHWVLNAPLPSSVNPTESKGYFTQFFVLKERKRNCLADEISVF